MRSIYTKYTDLSIQELGSLTNNWSVSDIEKGVIYKILAQKYFVAKNYELQHKYTDEAIKIFEALANNNLDHDICNS